ncbi:type IV pilus secretin PilQ [Pseudomonas sp. F(2018)]|uniref:type IV pilus secretin PilQ n=1 Tax=Pseudomonas sp. F(2018) TaxID=2502240 RepID=UPI0010F555DF|nr:type IV pilus secretin PilQ [Pseudomonas sp. F(2018)]
MNRAFSRLYMSLLLVGFAPTLLAANLQKIDVATLPGDKMELKLGFDGPVAAPRGYTIEQPARIALDLPGVSSKLEEKNRELGVGNARSLTVVEAQNRTRLIINLSTLVPYSTRSDGNNVIVVVGDSSGVQSSQVSATPSTMAKPVAMAQAGRAIRSIDFQRGTAGEGNVVIELSDPSVNPDIQDQGGKIRLEFSKTQLPESLRARLDVKDFATPVQFVNSSVQGDKVGINIEPAGDYDYLAFQTDNKLTISVKPLSPVDVEKRKVEAFAYSGEKLSLNFQDIDVRSVLQLIADFTNLNLVASDTVQGNITLRLQNVPWDQALDLVLKTRGLDKRQVGNVLLVAPADEIAARERQELEAKQQLAELAPLRREVVQLNYAKASDIAKLFEDAREGDLDKDMRGKVIFDDRTNSIIAYLTQARIDELRRIVVQLDIPVRQVMVEARIVEANVDFDKELGVEWRGVGLGDNNWVVGGTNSIEKDTDPLEFQGGTFVDMGAAGRTSGLNLGFITDNTLLDLELSAMEKTGNGEIISQPKVVTSDKETAKILKGTKIPYQEASSSGATSVAFAEANLSLEVTPQITPDNRVIMEVKVNKDAADFANQVDGTPSIQTNEVNAKVLVSDGETIVIGGIFSNTQSKAVDKVPLLGDIPYIGRLFRRDVVQDSKAELLVFLTPRIMNNHAIAVSQ